MDNITFDQHQDPDQVFHTDRWARYQWSRFLEASRFGAELLERGTAKIYSFPRFTREVFQRLHADTVEPLDRTKPEDKWAAKAHEQLGLVPEFDRLRSRCRGDRLLAGEAALALAAEVLERLPDPPAPLHDPEPLRQQVRGLMDFAKVNEPKDGRLDRDLAALQQQGRDAVQAAASYADTLDPSDLRNCFRVAVSAGQDQVTEIETCITAFCGWGTGPASPATTTPEVLAELVSRVRNSARLQAIAREAGRLRRIASTKQRSRVDHARDEVCDIELGADLGRVLPVELVKLTHPLLRLDFARRLQERSLLQYKLTGTERQGRGPIVVCLDQSSSMRGPKEFWSKGLALALLEVAALQRRTCRVVHFNTGVIRTDDWPAGKADPQELLTSMEAFAGGGTDFEPPLRAALDAIQREPGLKKADVVLVTDGEAQLSDEFTTEWSSASKKLAFTCYAVHIDAPGGVVPSQLEKIADKVIGLSDIADDTAATDTVLSI